MMVDNVFRYIDAVIHTIKDKKTEIKYADIECDNGICIILDQGMGDFILFSYYLVQIVEFFRKGGKNVTVFADTYNIEFVKAYAPGIEKFTIVLKRNAVKTINGEELIDFRGKFSMAITPCWLLTPRICLLLRILSPKLIFSISNKFFRRGYCLNDFRISKQISTLEISRREFYLLLHRRFAMKITGNDYGLKLQSPSNCERLINRDYFVVNLDASNNRKLLAREKFLDF